MCSVPHTVRDTSGRILDSATPTSLLAAEAWPGTDVARLVGEMRAVVWARLSPEGVLLDNNLGLRELLGPGFGLGADLRPFFLRPSFAELRARLAGPAGGGALAGIVTLLDREGAEISFNARVRRDEDSITFLGEHDVDGLRRLSATVLDLNSRLDQVHRDLIRLRRDLERREAELEQLALTDALTEVANRRALLRRLRHELERGRRYGSSFVVAMGDLDGFKAINDRCGHDGGDKALLLAAACLRAGTRASDEVGRWGGEEFLVILPETGLSSALITVDRLRLAVAEESRAGLAAAFSISFGLAASLPGDDEESLIKRADRALYAAKRAGRDCVRVCQI